MTPEPEMPRRREGDLVVQELAGETLVYDLRTHRAHCLNESAGRVWDACDGRTTIAALPERLAAGNALPVDSELVWLALRQLDRAGLLAEPLPRRRDAGEAGTGPRLTRRA